MADYSSLRVPELKKLLAERKLPQTGNKADLIARLQEEDKKTADSTPTAISTARPEQKEDDITYTDEEEPAAANAPEPSIKTQPTKPVPKKETEKSEPQSATTASAPKKPAEKGEAPRGIGDVVEPAQSFTLGLAKSASNTEAQKRTDRAKRFGIEDNKESKKRAERAKRFGIDEQELASGLDSALPERPLKRGHGRGGDDDVPSRKRQISSRRGDQHVQGGRATRQTRSGGPVTRGSVLDDPVEKAKAEKRAARFAAA